MLKLKTRILATASLAVVGWAGIAADASAAPNIYGAGSSLVAPYVRQAMDCYALPTQLIFKGTPPTFTSVTPFNYTGTQAQNCATTHTKTDRTVFYISTGSGTGIAGIFSHDPTKYGFVDAGQTKHFPEVYYGLSDAGLASSDVAIYNGGGTEQGVVVVAPGVTPGAGQYGNPLQLYGPMVQFPITVDPVTIAYNPVYKKDATSGTEVDYKFNLKHPRSDGSGGLHLDATTYCKIFTGQITDWNDPALKTLNGNQSLEDPADPTPSGSWSVPLQIVGRQESSGTTSIFTRHLAAVCGSASYVDGTTTLPAGLQGPVYDKSQSNNNSPVGETLGKYTLANGSDGVSKYVAFTAVPTSGTSLTQGRIGYLGPDYVLPAVLSTNINTYGLNTATLKNNAGTYESPTGTSAQAAFGSLSPPQSDATGHYDPSDVSDGNRNDPSAWVQGPSHSVALANPTATTAYPIVGTTNFIGYTCYRVGGQETTVDGFMGWYMTKPIVFDATNGILAKAGLAPVAKAWRTAIHETFVTNDSALGLNFSKVGSGTACSVSGVQGG